MEKIKISTLIHTHTHTCTYKQTTIIIKAEQQIQQIKK